MQISSRNEKPVAVLLHGWSWKNYSKFGVENPWQNRAKFLDALREVFEVYIVCFPGFCGIAEPDHAWHLEDFTDYVVNLLEKEQIKPDYVIGYSFGGAIATLLRARKQIVCPVILISPALVRAQSNKTRSLPSFAKKLFPQALVDVLRDAYLIWVVKNPYYVHGTQFLRSTYRNIVREDLSARLKEIPRDDFLCLFGSRDTATPPNLLFGRIDHDLAKRVRVIPGGTHDIANTNTGELMSFIEDFVTNTGEMK